MRVLKSTLIFVSGLLLSAAVCGVIMIGLPLGFTMLTENDKSEPQLTPEERREAESIWRLKRMQEAWVEARIRTMEELIDWEAWLQSEPGHDRRRYEWLAWLEAEPVVTADHPMSQVFNGVGTFTRDGIVVDPDEWPAHPAVLRALENGQAAEAP